MAHFMHSRSCGLITRRGYVRATPKGQSAHASLCRGFNDVPHYRCMPCPHSAGPALRSRPPTLDQVSDARRRRIALPLHGRLRTGFRHAPRRGDPCGGPRPVASAAARHRRTPASRTPPPPSGFRTPHWSRSGTFRRKWIWIPVDNGWCSPQACGAAWTAERCGGHGGDFIQGRRGASWTTSRPSGSA